MGSYAVADQAWCAVINLWSIKSLNPIPMTCLDTPSVVNLGADHGFSVNYYSQRADGQGTRWVAVTDVNPGQTIATWTGAYLSDGGQWTNASDRELKTDFRSIDPEAVLAKVAGLPITEWRYKSESAQRHVGPVAQDFFAAFRLGSDDKHIGTVDEAGVALAAIQGLHHLLEQKDEKIEAQQREINDQHRAIDELRDELDALKRAMAQLSFIATRGAQ
jgi:hypothetical protein